MAGQLSQSEIAEIREAFCVFDKDGDGCISVTEMKNVMHTLGQSPSETEIQNMISQADADGNGVVDFPEFLELVTNHMKMSSDPEEEIRAAFSVFDRDGDGFITASELRNVMANLGEVMSDEELAEVMAEADVDGNGNISYQEFAKMMKAK